MEATITVARNSGCPKNASCGTSNFKFLHSLSFNIDQMDTFRAVSTIKGSINYSIGSKK